MPQLVMAAGNDKDDYKNGGAVQKALPETVREASEFKEFEEMKHGWVIRGDTADEKIKRDVEDAVDRAKTFFGAKLAKTAM